MGHKNTLKSRGNFSSINLRIDDEEKKGITITAATLDKGTNKLLVYKYCSSSTVIEMLLM